MARAKKKAVKKKAVAKKKVATKKVVAKKAVGKKAVTKKAAVKKKASVKKAVTKKAAVKKAAVKRGKAVKDPMTKTQLFTELAERTELSKKQVTQIFDELADIIGSHVKKNAVGHFTLPGLMKVKTIRKPAQRARKNVPNPFRPGELMDVAAKPARTVVKVLPLKKLKDMV